MALDDIFAQEPLEVYDAVIVAPGGARDIATMAGQNSREYWNPINVENLPPGQERHQFAIIGSGNSAASEVLNFLVPKRDFLQIHRQVLKWRNDGNELIDRLLDLDYSQPIALKEYRETPTGEEWQALRALCFADLVQKDLL